MEFIIDNQKFKMKVLRKEKINHRQGIEIFLCSSSDKHFNRYNILTKYDESKTTENSDGDDSLLIAEDKFKDHCKMFFSIVCADKICEKYKISKDLGIAIEDWIDIEEIKKEDFLKFCNEYYDLMKKYNK